MLQSETPLETKVNNNPANSSPDNTPVNKDAAGNTQEERISLAELFKEPDESDASAEGNDSSATVDSLDAVAKRLKLTPEQIYAIKVPMKDNAEPLTIGTLKDRVAELVNLDTREMQFDQRRVKQEGELLRSQTEMREILSMLPPEAIKPELVKKLRDQRASTLANEQRATLEHIPEWNDEKRRNEDLTGIIEHLAQYGFADSFISTVNDHRALKYMRDNYLRDKRIKEALAKVTTPTKGNSKRPSAKSSQAPTKPNSNTQSTRRSGAPDMRTNLMQLFKDS